MQRKHAVFSRAVTVALVAGVLGAGAKSASAIPTTLGFYPSTDFVPQDNVHFNVSTYGQNLNMDASTTLGFTYGFGSQKDGLFGRDEIGFDYVDTLGGSVPVDAGTGGTLSAGRRLLYNAKAQLYNNDKGGVRLVTGVWGLGSKDIGSPDVGYISGSKAFKWGRITVGVAHAFANQSVLTTPGGHDDKTYLHLGYDKMLTKKLQFCTDFYSGKSAISGVQPTLYYYINDKADFGVGYFRTNDSTVAPSRNQVYLTFDYFFGHSSTPTPAATATPPATAPGAPAPAGTAPTTAPAVSGAASTTTTQTTTTQTTTTP